MKLQGLRWQAVLAGSVVDIATSFALGYLLRTIFAIASYNMSGQPGSDTIVQAAFTAVATILGLLLDVVGGFVAGLMGRSRPVLNAAGAGVLTIIIGVGIRAWLRVPLFSMGSLGVIPLTILGGVIAGALRPRQLLLHPPIPPPASLVSDPPSPPRFQERVPESGGDGQPNP